MKLKYKWISDEAVELYVDELYVGELSHEVFGWQGMKHASGILYNIADLLDWEIEIEGDPAI